MSIVSVCKGKYTKLSLSCPMNNKYQGRGMQKFSIWKYKEKFRKT